MDILDRISFSTGALYHLDTIEAMKSLKKAGFQNAELMPQCFDDLSLDKAKEYRKIGIRIASVHYPLAFFSMLYTAHPKMSEEGKELGKKIVEFAKESGTEIIVVHTTDETVGLVHEIIEKRKLDNMAYFFSLCQDNGLKIAMENHPTGSGNSPETLDQYSDAFGISAMTPMVDTTEVIEGGGDPVAFIRGLRRAPSHLHLSDFKDGKKHLPLGDGDVDWKEVIKAAQEKGFTGLYTLEPSYRYYLENLDFKLRESYLRLAALL